MPRAAEAPHDVEQPFHVPLDLSRVRPLEQRVDRRDASLFYLHAVEALVPRGGQRQKSTVETTHTVCDFSDQGGC